MNSAANVLQISENAMRHCGLDVCNWNGKVMRDTGQSESAALV